MIRFLVPLFALLLPPLATSAQTPTKADAEQMVIGLYVVDVAIELYDTLEAEAKAGKKDFCTTMTPGANEALKGLPPTL